MFSLICVRINGWLNNREAGDLRRYHGHYEVIVLQWVFGDLVTIFDLSFDAIITVPSDTLRYPEPFYDENPETHENVWPGSIKLKIL